MKKYFLAGLFLISFSNVGFANNLTCEIINNGTPETWTKSHLLVQIQQINASEFIVQSIQSVKYFPDSNGDVQQEIEQIYSSFTRDRFKVGYCSTNDNNYHPYSSSVYISSDCMIENSSDRLFYQAYLSKKEEGSIKLDVLFNNGDTLSRSIETLPCK
ncbi:MAG: hypothetical protein R3B45_16360 [Bdellovibrionota bacterium]